MASFDGFKRNGNSSPRFGELVYTDSLLMEIQAPVSSLLAGKLIFAMRSTKDCSRELKLRSF